MMRANYNDLDDGDDAQHKQLRTAVRNGCRPPTSRPSRSTS